jgi:hypothetical protein
LDFLCSTELEPSAAGDGLPGGIDDVPEAPGLVSASFIAFFFRSAS